jgi:hypothetical protein
VVVDGDGDEDRDLARIARSDTDGAGEATELGGFREPSVMIDAFEMFHVPALDWELCELWDSTLCLFFLLAALDFGCLFLTDSGTPSHLEFTLGTLSGSFFAE